ncbi:DUF3293 domain-containing protein [Comamonas sp. NLF-1-9]|uniref:DUF3293 domain-containing protein n=1 Tax=Comamonas sp. NLF-1-9 TaxID=2853163 RepID=UPI001C437DCC|nr:DUF3293 domain-containing protein [Comamonas sp. NLF-1-9]QXL83878.1 DUF3293 domain-containing protein [Comamonas sp. NLF-1-9]
MSAIPAELLAAYLETEYRVGGDAPFVLRIGEASAALRALHQRRRVQCSAFLSAANPGSQLLEPATNAQRHQALLTQLRRLGYAPLPGLGQHPLNGWPAEASWLVPGLAREAALQLARQWGQIALVFSAQDAIPGLVFTACG